MNHAKARQEQALASQSGHHSSSDATHDEPHNHEYTLNWRDITRVLFVAAAAGAVWFQRGDHALYITVIGVLCAVIGGFPILHEAYENIVERRMTMELSMTIAIVAALAIKEIFTALIITLFVLVAEILEGLTVGRGREAIQCLVDLLPNVATVHRGEEWQDVNVSEIARGDQVLVRPGARVPIDGTVIAGHSFVDQAPITGESMPVEKTSGALVYAGTINQSGMLEIQVERIGRDTTFGKIIEAVERAEKSRAPIQGIADRLAGYLVYFALGAALITFLITHNMRSTISVVIVAGACGIAAGTPLAILGAIGRAAQDGAIIKGGLYLEKLAEVDTILLDKTGTLTYGTPEVIDLRPANGITATTLLEAAATAESPSEHPVAKAILNKASEMHIHVRHPEHFDYTPGKGIVANLDSEEISVGNWTHFREKGAGALESLDDHSDGAVFVARDRHLLGSIRVADVVRPEAKASIERLQSLGLKTILLTGDSKAVAQDIGRALGVDEILAELLPEQKLQRVEKLLAEGRKVVMVGDGVNDAPALAQATVGVAMGSGTDVARESSDVVLIGSDLSKLVGTLQTARRCHRIIMQNFVGTLVIDTMGVALAAFGFLNPLLAAFIHVSSEMTFILNSARLLPPVSSAKKFVRGVLSRAPAATN
jgi:heavy metal translocating P-type ATPase